MRFLTRLAQEKKKSHKRNPKTAPELVKKKRRIDPMARSSSQ
jgi:hypothetical protein